MHPLSRSRHHFFCNNLNSLEIFMRFIGSLHSLQYSPSQQRDFASKLLIQLPFPEPVDLRLPSVLRYLAYGLAYIREANLVRNYVRRGDWYYYMRRVPRHLAKYDSRQHVRIALKTKCEREAQRLAGIYDNFIERYWKDLVRSKRSDEERGRFQEASNLAKAHGFAYKDMSAILDSPLEEILARVEATESNPRAKGPALLGTAAQSQITLTECPTAFWPLCADQLVDKKPHQVKRFKNPRILAMKNFTKAVGNLNVSGMERSHVIRFRNWLMTKIEKGEISGHTANKMIGHVRSMLHAVGINEEIDTDFKLLFAEIKFKERKGQRSSFEAGFVQSAFIGSPSLDGLNNDACMLFYAMAETGARESEIIGLDELADIFLDEEVPFIWIRSNRFRSLKTPGSDRKIPLVGVGLLAAKEIVVNGGITRYRKNPDSASGAINKYLLENGLRPTRNHTLYSLRHTFKDRLRDAGAPEEVIDELMGHVRRGFQYGRGHTLETKYRWLQEIAFDPPDDFAICR